MNIGTIQHVDIEDQMRSAYLDYAMSVIVARALPDARDGLKPVHRRILYAMHDMGVRSNSAFKKSARIVGEVLGKYHPHGDQAVYDAMVRMAQDFSMRYPLVDGQGNFGSVDGDSPAAMRYTEARLARMAEEMLLDIEKDTVDWGDNFDGSLQEPLVLPGRLPHLLLNGSSGIAVGMATNIPPHNLNELAAAIRYLIDRDEILALIAADDAAAPAGLVEKFGLSEEHAQRITRVIRQTGHEENDLTPDGSTLDLEDAGEATVDELMVFVKGPDFPTGGFIVGSEGIVSAYTHGKGRVVIRGVAQIDEMRAGRHRIVISEIPYQVNKTSLIERIAELVRQDRINMISDLRDESDRNGMRIVVELKRGAQPKKVLNQLYKYTALQSTFGVQMLALIPSTEDGPAEPRLISLRRALQLYIDHRRNIITRRSEYELAKAQARAHVLEGLLIAIANIDAVIQTIRAADDADHARTQLMGQFKLSELQAQAILDLQLRRLAALERLKIEQEHQEILERIAYLDDLLAHPKKILSVIKADLSELTEKYGDARTTRIAYDASGELSVEDMVADESVLVSITQRGYIKRMASKAFRAQGRGGKGVIGQDLRDEDEVGMMFSARSLQTILFFSDKGKVYSEKAYEIAAAGRTDKGVSLHSILALSAGEKVTAAVPVPGFDTAEYCTMVTRNGKIKRVPLEAFEAVRPSGLIAISLEEDDVLGWAQLTLAGEEIIIVTEAGQALRFDTKLVRPMGRAARGVNAISLKPGDVITGVEVVDDDADLLVVTENGYGKRTPMSEYPAKGRATGGVATINRKSLSTIGRIVAARRVVPEDQITIISANGQALRTRVKDIGRYGRATMGTRLMNLKHDDTVASVARLPAADLKGPVKDDVNENGREDLPVPPPDNGTQRDADVSSSA
ncbi:MAG: DNA gyrase subunit A [Anaerolineales bacterium]